MSESGTLSAATNYLLISTPYMSSALTLGPTY